ncbi:MAG: twin-arginine translocation signal domain-containing protein [Pirellulales bacterium]|nr:twin-arginine translocation signal domain-containing protein [Pirellulales bacterium]
MKKQNVNVPKCCRREFMKDCVLGAAAAGAVGSLFVGQSQAAEDELVSRFNYKPVPGWAKLPKDVAWAGVNGIDVDRRGRVYAAGGDENAVLVFAPDGKFLRAWGKGLIEEKHQLRIFNDKVYVADTAQHQVYEFDLNGKLLRAFGTRGKAGLGKNEFNKPTDIAFGPDGDIFITDGYGNSRVVRLAPDGSFRLAWGEKGSLPGQFVYPHNIVIDKAGLVYVADRGNNRVQIFSPEGRFLRQLTNVGKPFGLFLTADGIMFVSDGNPEGPHRILALDLAGKVLAEFGSTGKGPGQFDVPHSIAIDADKNLYVAEVNNKRIQKFTLGNPSRK